MPNHTIKNEQGSVLFIIFITIALFAALSFAYTKMGTGGEEVMSEGEARLVATDILDYSRDIERAVNRLIVKGCSESEISFNFDTNGDGNYNATDWFFNANSPSDFSCHVMHPATGGQIYFEPDEAQEKSWMLPSDLTYPFAVAPWDYFVEGVGEAGYRELIWFIPSVSLEVCLQINKMLGVDNPSGVPPRDTVDSAIEGGSFDGDFLTATVNIIDAPELVGKHAGCYVTDDQAGASNAYDGTDYYYFYHVLIVR